MLSFESAFYTSVDKLSKYKCSLFSSLLTYSDSHIDVHKDNNRFIVCIENM